MGSQTPRELPKINSVLERRASNCSWSDEEVFYCGWRTKGSVYILILLVCNPTRQFVTIYKRWTNQVWKGIRVVLVVHDTKTFLKGIYLHKLNCDADLREVVSVCMMRELLKVRRLESFVEVNIKIVLNLFLLFYCTRIAWH